MFNRSLITCFVSIALCLALLMAYPVRAESADDSYTFGFQVIDADSEKPLCGAVIYVIDLDTFEVHHVSTGDDGIALFSDMPASHYMAFQSSATAGYTASDWVTEFDCPDSGWYPDFNIEEVYNTPITVNAFVEHRDGSSPAGTSILLRGDNGYEASLSVGDDGAAIFSALPYGTYQLCLSTEMPTKATPSSYTITIDEAYCDSETMDYIFLLD